ncbi:hypothetical protein KTJ20_09945 [Acinetobacter ursingii]|uniref:hypothetical protein n=1 Tax=Acinetobacter ursingii TaxID=108980 RepID=UPI0021CDD0FD|nr:hypothetical protein [Acinetobacter ursingii]MCU4589071.1 hypothetical protein [Acinetobacter ursingii]
MENIIKDIWGDEYTQAQAISVMKEFENLDMFFEQVEDSKAWRELYIKNKAEIDEGWNR